MDDAEIVLIQTYLDELLARCRLSLLVHESIGGLVKEGCSHLSSRKFSSVTEKRWDTFRTEAHFESNCHLNFLKDLPSCVAPLQDTSLKVTVKSAITVVSERLQEAARMIDSQKKMATTYQMICEKLEDAGAASYDDGQSNTSLSKALQGSCSDFHRTERALVELTEECNAVLASLQISAKDWLVEIREVEEKRLLWNREALDAIINALGQSVMRRSEICAKSEESIGSLDTLQSRDDVAFEASLSVSKAPVSGHSDGMAVDILEQRAADALAWAESRHMAFSQAHWLLTGCLQDERAYVKAMDRVLVGYGFEQDSPDGFQSASGGGNSVGKGSGDANRSSGVESFFNKIKEGIDGRVARSKAFCEKLNALEAPHFREAWMTLYRLLRRSGSGSLVTAVEPVLKDITDMLLSLDMLRDSLKRVIDAEASNLAAVRAKSDTISARKAGNEASVADLHRALEKMLKLQSHREKERQEDVEMGAEAVNPLMSAAAGAGIGAGAEVDEDEDAALLDSALQLSPVKPGAGAGAGDDLSDKMTANGDDGVDSSVNESIDASNLSIDSAMDADASFDALRAGSAGVGGGAGKSSVGFSIGMDSAAVKMGVMSAENSVLRTQKKIDSLQVAIGKDEEALTEVASVYEKALGRANSELTSSLQTFFRGRQQLLKQGSQLVRMALSVFKSAVEADRALLATLRSEFDQQTLAQGQAHFLEYCRQQASCSSPSELAKVLHISRLAFRPCGSQFVMRLRDQRLLPPIMISASPSPSPSPSPSVAADAPDGTDAADADVDADVDAARTESVERDLGKAGEEGKKIVDLRGSSSSVPTPSGVDAGSKEPEVHAFVDVSSGGDGSDEFPVGLEGQDGGDSNRDRVVAGLSSSVVEDAASSRSGGKVLKDPGLIGAVPLDRVDSSVSDGTATSPEGHSTWRATSGDNSSTSSSSSPLPAPVTGMGTGGMGTGGEVVSPSVAVRKGIDMDTATSMAREQSANSRNRTSSFTGGIVDSLTSGNSRGKGLPALYPKEDLKLATELALPGDQRIINYYSCCTFPQPWALVQGTMYITQKYICFRGWPDTACKLKISMTDVHRIERENTAVVIPNAIRVYLSSGEEILFSSFIDRDPCYSLLDSSIQAEKHYAKIVAEENVSSSSLHPARLRYVDSAGSAEPSVLRDVASAEDLADLGARAGAGADAGIGEGDGEGEGGPKAWSDGRTTTIPSSLGAAPVSASTATPHRHLEGLFEYRGLSLLAESNVAVSVSSLWEACWKCGGGYKDFLTSMGDFDVSVEEWDTPLTPGGALDCPEDTTGLTFVATRSCSYSHPRTTMLMFGPKNAPATQKQYLFLQGRGVDDFVEGLHDAGGNPRDIPAIKGSSFSGCVLTVTQFDGIPMADVFKVLQYWVFEPCKSAPISHTTVRSGFAVHYIKSSLFQNQISSGVKDELVEQVRKWTAFATVQSKAMQLPRADPQRLSGVSSDEVDRVLLAGEEGPDDTPRPSSINLSDTPSAPLDSLAKQWRERDGGLGSTEASSSGLRGLLSAYLGATPSQIADLTLCVVVALVLLVMVLLLQNRAMARTLAEHERLLGELDKLRGALETRGGIPSFD